MRNDAPTRRGDVTEPNEFRRRQNDEEERRRLIALRVIDVLTALAVLAIVALFLKMIFY
jgi:hypothetical protein